MKLNKQDAAALTSAQKIIPVFINIRISQDPVFQKKYRAATASFHALFGGKAQDKDLRNAITYEILTAPIQDALFGHRHQHPLTRLLQPLTTYLMADGLATLTEELKDAQQSLLAQIPPPEDPDRQTFVKKMNETFFVDIMKLSKL